MIKNLVYLSIFTTFVVLVWISLTIYHALTFSTITKDVGIQITPLNPTFNTSVISDLRNREQIPANFDSVLSTPSAVTITPVPSVSPIVAQPTKAVVAPAQPSASSGNIAPAIPAGSTKGL